MSLRRDGAWVGDLGVVSGVGVLAPAPAGGLTLEANLFSRNARLVSTTLMPAMRQALCIPSRPEVKFSMAGTLRMAIAPSISDTVVLTLGISTPTFSPSADTLVRIRPSAIDAFRMPP